MRITSESANEAGPPEVVESDASSKQPSFTPVIGFRPADFVGRERVVTVFNDRYLCHADLRECVDDFTFVDMGATVSSWVVSSSFLYLVVCIEHKHEGPVVVVKDASSLETLIWYRVR